MSAFETLLTMALSMFYLSGFVWGMVWSEGSRDSMAFRLFAALFWPVLLVFVLVDMVAGNDSD